MGCRHARRHRVVLVVDAATFAAAVGVFALLPLSTLNGREAVAVLWAVIALVLLVCHAAGVRLRGAARFGYAASGALGLWTLLHWAVEVLPFHEVNVGYEWGVAGFLLAGAVSGYAGHVIDG